MHYNKSVNEETSSNKIYLVDQSTWLPWINIIKAKATRGSKENVWRYIDPNLTTQPELPVSPQEPMPSDVKATASSILDLDSAEFAKFQYLEKRYIAQVNHNKVIMHSIQEIDSYVMGSIEINNELWTRDASTTWALLKALQKRLAPTDHSKKAEVIRSYNALKTYDRNQPVVRFLYEWERVYGLAKSLNIPDVSEERPLYDFALALQAIDESYATNLELRIDQSVRQRSMNATDSLMQLEDIIEEFRNFYNRHQLIRQKPIPASFAASQNETKRDHKTCLCGSVTV